MALEFDEIGERYPAISLYDEVEQRVDLLSVAGGARYLLVSYCAIWCGPCGDFARDLPGIAASLGPDLAFVEVVMQRHGGIPSLDPEDAAIWADQHGFGPGTAVRVLTTGGNADDYDLLDEGASVSGFPTYHLIDTASGRLVGWSSGYDTAAGFVSFVQDAIANDIPPAAPVTMVGNAGDNARWGGSGDDNLMGNDGNDRLKGKDGYDTLRGGEGDDDIRGGRHGDDISGGVGQDTLHGQRGNDLVNGDLGDDRIFGGAGEDTLNGGEGHDFIWGGDDNDLIFGGAGNDTLHGRDGENTIHGDDGDDVLYVEDRPEWSSFYDLYGGAGADTFVLRSGYATIHDAEVGDSIVLGRNVANYEFDPILGGVEMYLYDADDDFIGWITFHNISETGIEALIL